MCTLFADGKLFLRSISVFLKSKSNWIIFWRIIWVGYLEYIWVHEREIKYSVWKSNNAVKIIQYQSISSLSLLCFTSISQSQQYIKSTWTLLTLFSLEFCPIIELFIICQVVIFDLMALCINRCLCPCAGSKRLDNNLTRIRQWQINYTSWSNWIWIHKVANSVDGFRSIEKWEHFRVHIERSRNNWTVMLLLRIVASRNARNFMKCSTAIQWLYFWFLIAPKLEQHNKTEIFKVLLIKNSEVF